MQRKKLIPIALLAVLLIGVASAFLYSYVYTAVSTVNDPLTFSIYKDLPATMYPGETVEVIFQIANAAPVTYGAIITVTLYGSLSGTATASWETATYQLTAISYALSEFNIATGTGYAYITVTLPPGAAAGTIQVGFQVERVAAF
jgi:hypothetical protein